MNSSLHKHDSLLSGTMNGKKFFFFILLHFSLLRCYAMVRVLNTRCAFMHAKSFSGAWHFATYGRWPTRLLSVRGDSPGNNTGVGGYLLLQGIFPTQWLNLCRLCLYIVRLNPYHQHHLESPSRIINDIKNLCFWLDYRNK